MKIFSKFRKKQQEVINFLNRSPRVRINPFHTLKLIIDDKNYEIANISVSGIGIKTDRDLKERKTAEEISAQLILNDEKLDIKFVLIHHGDQTTGVRVTHPTTKFENFIWNCFLVEFKGLSLKQVKPELIRKIQKGTPYWFYGDNSHELYFVTYLDGILNFHINFEDFFLQKDAFGFYNLGKIEDDDDGPHHKKSNILNNAEKIPKDKYDLVLRFIEVIPGLDSQITKQLRVDIKKMCELQWGQAQEKQSNN